MANADFSMPCHIVFSRTSSWCVLLHCATLIQEHFWNAQKAQEEGSEPSMFWYAWEDTCKYLLYFFLITLFKRAECGSDLYLWGVCVLCASVQRGLRVIHSCSVPRNCVVIPRLVLLLFIRQTWDVGSWRMCPCSCTWGRFCWRILHLQDSECWHAAMVKEPVLEPLECVSCSLAWRRCGPGR